MTLRTLYNECLDMFRKFLLINKSIRNHSVSNKGRTIWRKNKWGIYGVERKKKKRSLYISTITYTYTGKMCLDTKSKAHDKNQILYC